MDTIRPRYPALHVHFDGSLGLIASQDYWSGDVDQWFWTDASDYLIDSDAAKFDQQRTRSEDGRALDVPEWVYAATLSADDVYSLAASAPDPKIQLPDLDKVDSANARIAFIIRYLQFGDESIVRPDDSLTPSRVRLDSFLPRSESKLVFAFVMACYSWTLSSFLGALFRAFSSRRPPAGLFASSTSPAHALGKSFELLIFSPVFETLLLVAIIEILRALRFPVGFQIFIAALILCLCHSISWLPWGVIVAPGFALGAFAYTHWRSTSKQTALGITILMHLMHNAIPAILDVSRAWQRAS